ncbi:hypothetical protein TEA_013710 [Camellia sinensis var. sinensis]|uniref:Uncharacterized protein n=1 Tax=Camellia sinensis var. sinensis TaxID=542762 RepID=A0A4S4DM98_CAMSN|nr:hypothetical protein TEA_013710 [Camellia sinensis var. sinensis]
MRRSALDDNMGAPFDGMPFYGLGTPFGGTLSERLGTLFGGATLEKERSSRGERGCRWGWLSRGVVAGNNGEAGGDRHEVVEDDLVAARQADRSLGSQDFSRWLTMGRLMSVSFGETRLSLEHWQMVKELERLRTERLQLKIN